MTGPAPRLHGGPARCRPARPPASATLSFAALNRGRWTLDSTSDDEASAHNRASYLRRRAGAGWAVRYSREAPGRWIVLVMYGPGPPPAPEVAP
jgi:hypothetical protein